MSSKQRMDPEVGCWKGYELTDGGVAELSVASVEADFLKRRKYDIISILVLEYQLNSFRALIVHRTEFFNSQYFSKSIASCTVAGVPRPLLSGSHNVKTPMAKLMAPKIT